MAFLRESAVKDLMMRGPSLEELLDWIDQNVVFNDDLSYSEIEEYFKSFGLVKEEFETLVNILIGQANDEEKDYLYDLLFNLNDRDETPEIEEEPYYPRLGQ